MGLLGTPIYYIYYILTTTQTLRTYESKNIGCKHGYMLQLIREHQVSPFSLLITSINNQPTSSLNKFSLYLAIFSCTLQPSLFFLSSFNILIVFFPIGFFSILFLVRHVETSQEALAAALELLETSIHYIYYILTTTQTLQTYESEHIGNFLIMSSKFSGFRIYNRKSY